MKHVKAVADVLTLDDIAVNDPEFFFKLSVELSKRGYQLEARQRGIHGTHISLTKTNIGSVRGGYKGR